MVVTRFYYKVGGVQVFSGPAQILPLLSNLMINGKRAVGKGVVHAQV